MLHTLFFECGDICVEGSLFKGFSAWEKTHGDLTGFELVEVGLIECGDDYGLGFDWRFGFLEWAAQEE